MSKKKVFINIFLLLFIGYIVCFVIGESGYYEYKLQRKTVMTNESMQKFEEDVKEGKDVSLEDYVVSSEKDYTTTLTRTTNKVSKSVNKMMKKTVEGVFKVLGSFVEN